MPDTIYFAQHGLAVDKAENPERPLSQTGIIQTQAIAEMLNHSKVRIKTIFHSGKCRAAQTAEIFAAAVKTTSIVEIEGLSPNDDIQRLLPKLQDKSLYVGHLPHLNKICSFLLTRDESTDILQFKNSGILCLTLDKPLARLNWFLIPELVLPENHS